VIFNFKSYGLEVQPLSNLQVFWADPHTTRSTLSQGIVIALVWVAFLLNTQLRMAGAVPLLWRSRLRLDPVQWFLLGGTLAGPAVFLALNGWNSAYFTHAGLAFGVLLSAWGYCEVFERAALTARGKALLGLFALLFTGLGTWAVFYRSSDWLDWLNTTLWDRHPWAGSFLIPFLGQVHGCQDGSVPMTAPQCQGGSATVMTAIVFAGVALAALALVAGLLWWGLSRVVPGMRRRGGLVLLTGALLAGVPTLVIDLPTPIWDSSVWGAKPLPAGKIDAARWLRAHSKPTDVLVTNEHCWSGDDFKDPKAQCADYRDFTLSAYSERSVLVEGSE
jgi:hypothetical protein